MEALRAAVLEGAPGRGGRGAGAPRVVPGGGGAGVGAGDVRRARVGRQGPAQVDPSGRRARPGTCSRRGLRRRDGVVDQLQHGVDVDLRAPPDVRVPEPARQGERLGCAPRAAVPRDRQRRRRRGGSGRVRRPGVEARRPRHRPLQPRRRSGPVGARRLDARVEPTDLGLRDQLRRPRRAVRGEGQPADAEARAPHLGGGGGQRADELDELPHARESQRRADDPGPDGADLGRQRRDRRVRVPVRAQRRRHAGSGRFQSGAGCAAPRAGCRARHRPKGRGLPILDRRRRPRTRPNGDGWARRSASSRASTPRSCSSIRGARRWGLPSSSARVAERSSRARRRAAS